MSTVESAEAVMVSEVVSWVAKDGVPGEFDPLAVTVRVTPGVTTAPQMAGPALIGLVTHETVAPPFMA